MYRNPIESPIEDKVNILAELHEKGYYHCSLKFLQVCYFLRSQTYQSDSIGQHLLVSCILKGAFNERPPQPKYSSFWDVGQMLTYIRNLGPNEGLTLQQLMLKLEMLMAFTRPSCSADLSQHGINHRSFSAEGVTFQPIHLSKQSIGRTRQLLILPSHPLDQISIYFQCQH